MQNVFGDNNHVIFPPNCPSLALTEPAVIKTLSVSDITTSSVSLSWTEPEGKSSFYRIEWSGGNETMNDTTKLTVFNITKLTAGVKYTFKVIAVAGDNITEGENRYKSLFTSKPGFKFVVPYVCLHSD